ncbi:MAG: response regulator [Candidatus Buchananbacteria bacterium]|nr:response regulator [Candidatus Buchananbacteria bacterium]
MAKKKSYKILVVEDEPALQQTLGDKIKREGWEYIPSLNGEEGLRTIKKSQPDLIILDLLMPKMSGLEMLKEVRKIYDKQDLPVIILTNYSEGQNVSEAIALGADIFLVKANYSLEEIIEKIREVLD